MGFEPLPPVENKELKDSAFLTIRRIRTNAWVEARIEHAEFGLAARRAVLVREFTEQLGHLDMSRSRSRVTMACEEPPMARLL